MEDRSVKLSVSIFTYLTPYCIAFLSVHHQSLTINYIYSFIVSGYKCTALIILTRINMCYKYNVKFKCIEYEISFDFDFHFIHLIITVDKAVQLELVVGINVIYCFSSTSRSTKAIFQFQKLRSLLEIAQNILIVHHIDQ